MVGSENRIFLAAHRPAVRGRGTDDLPADPLGTARLTAVRIVGASDNTTTRHTTTTRNTSTTAEIIADDEITRKELTLPVDGHSTCGQSLPLNQAVQPNYKPVDLTRRKIGLDGLTHRLLKKLAASGGGKFPTAGRRHATPPLSAPSGRPASQPALPLNPT